MRRGNPHDSLTGGSRSLEILLHPVPQGPDFRWIRGSRKSCLPHRTFAEGQKTPLLKLGVSLVLKKARLAQRLEQMSSLMTVFRVSQGAGKLRLQIQLCSHSIEQQKGWYQGR